MKTKYGTARLNKDRYYEIISLKEGNYGELLHRLIYEDYYGPVKDCYEIQHKDFDKTNNNIENLVGPANKQSYNIFKQKNMLLNQGFTYVYQYRDGTGKKKRISCIDYAKLKDKVLKKGLPFNE